MAIKTAGSGMKKMREFIESGVIESYVLGLATPSEAKEVEQMCVAHDEVRAAIDKFSEMLEHRVLSEVAIPNPIVKPMLLATLNYMDRMEKGEPASFPPILNEDSRIENYSEWLQRQDMKLPAEADDVFARIIAYTPEITTAIVWIKSEAPAEVHTNEIEKFLILEGTCELLIENEAYQLSAGDFFQIPLFKSHRVNVTSGIPCKVILQRSAA